MCLSNQLTGAYGTVLAGEEFGDEHDRFDRFGNVDQDGGKQVDPVKVPTDDPPKPAVVAVPAPTTASTCEEVQTSCKNLVAHILAHEFINCGESGKICQARAQELANAANAKCGAAYQDCLGAKGLHDATKGATENWKGEWAAKAKAKAKAHVKSDDAGDKKDDGDKAKGAAA